MICWSRHLLFRLVKFQEPNEADSLDCIQPRASYSGYFRAEPHGTSIVLEPLGC